MVSKIPVVFGYAGASVYTNGLGYDRYYPWKRKSEHADTIMLFVRNVGTPLTTGLLRKLMDESAETTELI
jgi:hypothetical protein